MEWASAYSPAPMMAIYSRLLVASRHLFQVVFGPAPSIPTIRFIIQTAEDKNSFLMADDDA